MGRASRAKSERRSLARLRPQLEKKLAEQSDLLTHLGRLYDDTTPAAALPLATALRVLLHDTQQSHALLAQLGMLDEVKFIDTAMHINPYNILPTHNGLVIMEVNFGGDGGRYVPRCQNEYGNEDNPPLSFGTWWSATVIRDSARRTWSRRSAVLALANKEGGAHIDPHQPEDIKALEVDNSMGWVYTHDGQESPFTNGPLAPTVRQIAYEVEQTLDSR